jgi:hypothetical protein
MTVSVENVEKAFGIPQMTTTHDSERIADYGMKVSGNGGWKAVIWVRESDYLGDIGPARFKPGLRPQRLYRLDDPDSKVNLLVDIRVFGLNPVLGSYECVPVEPLVDAFSNAEWPKLDRPISSPTDGGTPGYFFESGDKRVAFDDRGQKCAQSVTIMQGRN